MKNTGRSHSTWGRTAAISVLIAFALLAVTAEFVVSTPSGQAEPTPPPVRREITVIVRGQGASLSDSPAGTVVDRLIVGARLTATGRSIDGRWIYVVRSAGEAGWILQDALLGYGLDRLPIRSPGIDTPSPTATGAPASPPVTPTGTVVTTAAAEPSATAAEVETTTPATGGVLALAGRSGARIWRPADGALLAEVEAGARLLAYARTDDGAWYLVLSPAGVQGWASAGEMLVPRADTLPFDELQSPTVRVGEESDVNTPTGITVVVEAIGARLNIRAGPGTEYPILAKAEPGALFTARGRTGGSEWIEVELADNEERLGWLASAFVTADRPITDLPVVP